MKEDAEYDALFADSTDLKIYQVCAELYFAVSAYFKKESKAIDTVYRNNLRYHLMMQLAWQLNESRPIHIAALRQLKVSTLTDATIKKVLDHTIAEFDKVGAADKTVKSDAFTRALQKASLVKTSSLATPADVPTAPAAAPAPVAPPTSAGVAS